LLSRLAQSVSAPFTAACSSTGRPAATAFQHELAQLERPARPVYAELSLRNIERRRQKFFDRPS
jgi:hypothetical protein